MSKLILTTGMKIVIYDDPLTRAQPKGEAILVKQEEQNFAEIDLWQGFPVESWRVRFVDDPEEKLYIRNIWTKPTEENVRNAAMQAAQIKEREDG